MGLNVGQLYQKHYWVFLAFVIASERVAWYFNVADDEPLDCAEYEQEFQLEGQFA
jgi:hypothetical protein